MGKKRACSKLTADIALCAKQGRLLLQVGKKLARSKRKADISLGAAIAEELVAPWREAEADRKRAEEAASAREAQRAALVEAGRNRSMRERRKVHPLSVASNVCAVLWRRAMADPEIEPNFWHDAAVIRAAHLHARNVCDRSK